MASFKDSEGRSWKTAVNVTTVRRVKDLTGIYLPALVDDSFKGFADLANDVIQFIDVLYAVCKPDADANNVTPEKFGEGLHGDSLEKASRALVEGVIDFFQEDRRRALRIYLEKAQAVKSRLMERGEMELNKVDPERIAEEMLARASRSAIESNDSSGSVQESSESIPAPSP